MSPHNKLQWIGFCVHTIVVYTIGKMGPRLLLEVGADVIVSVLRVFVKREKKK